MDCWIVRNAGVATVFPFAPKLADSAAGQVYEMNGGQEMTDSKTRDLSKMTCLRMCMCVSNVRPRIDAKPGY